MFYYRNWESFCKQIKGSDYITCRADESFEIPKTSKFIVLKHDVEANVAKALRLAEIEHRHGIKGTYYVQAYLLNDNKNIELLRQMSLMGHEISYHYDVLDANSGDYIRADKDFSKWISRFNSAGFNFKTICQHGNPVKERIGYNSNRDFFRNSKIRAKYPNLVDMVVNFSEHINRPYLYISDAGYMWKHITEPETNDIHPDAENIQIGDFDRLIDYINKSNTSIIVSTHPHRWESSLIKIGSKILIFRVVRGTVRQLERIPCVKRVLNKFYFLAKRI